MPKIWTHIAWDHTGQKDLGKAYNACLSQHADEDWVAFLDHDGMFTTNDWYLQLQHIIEHNPKCKGITARINRMATPDQMVLGIDPNNFDYGYHRKVGKYLAKKHKNQSSIIKNRGHMSGVFFALHVGTIKSLGGCVETGMQLQTDHMTMDRVRDAGHEFRIADGIYIFHWYRHDAPYEHSKPAIEQLEQIHFDTLRINKW